VSNVAGVQSEFWSGAPNDIRTLGDYAHFTDYAASWPAVPPTDYVGQALAQAVTAGADLASLVASAEQQANAWLVQQSDNGASTR
jgi:hypothetical protein